MNKINVEPIKQISDRETQKILKTSGSPYSPEAKSQIESLALDYAYDLASEGTRLAKREGLQQIGTAHVYEAKKRLFSIDRRNWIKRLSNSIGGILIGSGFSVFLYLGAGYSITSITSSIIITGGFFVFLGAILLMFGIRN